MKYKVQCQTLVEFEIEADTLDQAEEIARVNIIAKCLYDADSINWLVSIV